MKEGDKVIVINNNVGLIHFLKVPSIATIEKVNDDGQMDIRGLNDSELPILQLVHRKNLVLYSELSELLYTK